MDGLITDLYEAVKRRKDLRSYYKNDPITDEVLGKITFSDTFSFFSRIYSQL